MSIPNNIPIIQEKPTAIIGEEKVTGIQTQQSFYPVDGVFVLRDAIAPDQLIPGLKTDGVHIVVNEQMQTNLPGCFACGDITGKPYQYIKSAGQGNIAALSAVAWLAQLKKEKS